MDNNYKNKYLKYKIKYLQLKNGGYFNYIQLRDESGNYIEHKDGNGNEIIKNYDINTNSFVFNDIESLYNLFSLYNFNKISNYKNTHLINSQNYRLIDGKYKLDDNTIVDPKIVYKLTDDFKLERYNLDEYKIEIKDDYNIKQNNNEYLLHVDTDYIDNIYSIKINYLYNYYNYYNDNYLNILIDNLFYNLNGTQTYDVKIDANLINKFIFINKFDIIKKLLLENINFDESNKINKTKILKDIKKIENNTIENLIEKIDDTLLDKVNKILEKERKKTTEQIKESNQEQKSKEQIEKERNDKKERKKLEKEIIENNEFKKEQKIYTNEDKEKREKEISEIKNKIWKNNKISELKKIFDNLDNENKTEEKKIEIYNKFKENEKNEYYDILKKNANNDFEKLNKKIDKAFEDTLKSYKKNVDNPIKDKINIENKFLEKICDLYLVFTDDFYLNNKWIEYCKNPQMLQIFFEYFNNKNKKINNITDNTFINKFFKIYKYYLNLFNREKSDSEKNNLALLENHFIILEKYLKLQKNKDENFKKNKIEINDTLKKTFNKEVKANKEHYYYSFIFKITLYRYIINNIENKNIVNHILNDYFIKRTIKNKNELLINKKQQFNKNLYSNEKIKEDVNIIINMDYENFKKDIEMDKNFKKKQYINELEKLLYNQNILNNIEDPIYRDYSLINQQKFFIKNNNSYLDRPDCGETTLINLVNLLLFNKKYKLNENNILYEFYKKNPIEKQKLNNNIHNEWFFAISNLKNIEYYNNVQIKKSDNISKDEESRDLFTTVQKIRNTSYYNIIDFSNNKIDYKYEIIPTITNIINILNIIFNIDNNSISKEFENDINNNNNENLVKTHLDTIFKKVNFDYKYELKFKKYQNANVYELKINKLNLILEFHYGHGSIEFEKNSDLQLIKHKVKKLIINYDYKNSYYLKNIFLDFYNDEYDFFAYNFFSEYELNKNYMLNKIIEMYLFNPEFTKKYIELSNEKKLDLIEKNSIFANKFLLENEDNINLLYDIISRKNSYLLNRYISLVDKFKDKHNIFLEEEYDKLIPLNFIFNGFNYDIDMWSHFSIYLNDEIYNILKNNYNLFCVDKILNKIKFTKEKDISAYELMILKINNSDLFKKLYDEKFIFYNNILNIYLFIEYNLELKLKEFEKLKEDINKIKENQNYDTSYIYIFISSKISIFNDIYNIDKNNYYIKLSSIEIPNEYINKVNEIKNKIINLSELLKENIDLFKTENKIIVKYNHDNIINLI